MGVDKGGLYDMKMLIFTDTWVLKRMCFTSKHKISTCCLRQIKNACDSDGRDTDCECGAWSWDKYDRGSHIWPV